MQPQPHETLTRIAGEFGILRRKAFLALDVAFLIYWRLLFSLRGCGSLYIKPNM